MLKLFRLPFVLMKWVVFAVLVAVGVTMVPSWTEGLSVSHVVQAVLSTVEWMLEQAEKLQSGWEELWDARRS